MSGDGQAAFFIFAFACFLVAAVVSFSQRAIAAGLIALGAAAWVFVLTQNALDAT